MAAIGGPTNGVIHLLALAREAKISFFAEGSAEDFPKDACLM